ncbi:hypothetical protein DCC85_22715 [Paenibacillus sp. CAA11]|uniref:hypothetical protein n=1 Tax=Paenibacillus sp. CAA11 TaxID=1532905 RepID=UPI000D3D43DA|nr:hypothetical protein [Paenibacillus sp. CAA11]AWB46708.1 hypothetical protein DCC85_22715 [Paenibacillus sp. CAA11]
MDKRTGRKTVGQRVPIEVTALPSYSLEEAQDYFIKVKRANNLKERTIIGYKQNMQYFIYWRSRRSKM